VSDKGNDVLLNGMTTNNPNAQLPAHTDDATMSVRGKPCRRSPAEPVIQIVGKPGADLWGGPPVRYQRVSWSGWAHQPTTRTTCTVKSRIVCRALA